MSSWNTFNNVMLGKLCCNCSGKLWWRKTRLQLLLCRSITGWLTPPTTSNYLSPPLSASLWFPSSLVKTLSLWRFRVTFYYTIISERMIEVFINIYYSITFVMILFETSATDGQDYESVASRHLRNYDRPTDQQRTDRSFKENLETMTI